MSKETWRSTRVFPPRGVAFYDGILIRSDSIYNPRPDRVLPISREEQIFVSRMIEPRLQSGWRVLDVGTGSGIYAIEAARQDCRVVAIDNNPRACRFLRSNAEWNAITIVEYRTEIGEGQIAVLEDEFNENFNDAPFDAIILSPAYTPTPPGLEYLVAPHAAAGHDGLEQFRKQIKNVPRLLKTSGICFGNQLSLVRKPPLPASLDSKSCSEVIQDQDLSDYIEVISIIKESFAGDCTIRCVPIFADLYPTTEFIKAEFAGAEELINKEEETKNKIEKWRNELASEFPYFALVYYEIRRGGEGQVTLGQTPWTEILEEERQSFTWDNRVRLHRAGVDHRLRQGFDPLPVFLTNGTTDSLLSYESALVIKDESSESIRGVVTDSASSTNEQKLERNRILQKNPLALIDKEIQDQEFGDLFSAIYIDTTPILPKGGGHYESYLERRVWVNGIGRASMAKDQSIIKTAKEILNEWERVTTVLQAAKCGIGFHPAFTSFVSEPKGWRWPEIISTDFPFKLEHRKKAFKIAKSLVRRRFDEKLKDNSNKSKQTKFSKVEEFFYSKSTLNDLEAKSYAANYDAFLERIETLKADLRSQAPDEYQRLNQRNIEQELGHLDLFACQLVMHETIHESLRETINRASTVEQKGKWADESMVFSIPLGMIFYERTADRRDFPPFFKGGLWAWFVPSSRRKLRHEEAANHLLQVMWVLLTASYSAISEQEFERLAKSKVTENFAHEVKKVSTALTSEMIAPAYEFFELKQSRNPSAAFGGKLGRIELASDMQDVLNDEDLGITFFQQSVASTGSMINFWCQDPNISDAAGVVGGEYKNIRSLVNACWRVCINNLPVFALARKISIDRFNPVKTIPSIAEMKQDEAALRGLFWDEIIVDGHYKFPALAWQDTVANKGAIKETTWLVRLFLALLNNCAAHSNPAFPVRIKFTPDKIPSKYIIEVINKRRDKTGADKASIIAALVHKGVDAEQAQSGLELLAIAAPARERIKVAKFGTREVVKSCLEQLKGEMINWPPDTEEYPESADSDFVVRFIITYVGEG